MGMSLEEMSEMTSAGQHDAADKGQDPVGGTDGGQRRPTQPGEHLAEPVPGERADPASRIVVSESANGTVSMLEM